MKINKRDMKGSIKIKQKIIIRNVINAKILKIKKLKTMITKKKEKSGEKEEMQGNRNGNKNLL